MINTYHCVCHHSCGKIIYWFCRARKIVHVFRQLCEADFRNYNSRRSCTYLNLYPIALKFAISVIILNLLDKFVHGKLTRLLTLFVFNVYFSWPVSSAKTHSYKDTRITNNLSLSQSNTWIEGKPKSSIPRCSSVLVNQLLDIKGVNQAIWPSPS